MAKANQYQRIVDYIRLNGSISEYDAHRIGIMKLSARLSEMKRLGYPLKGTWYKGVNEFGTHRYMRYTLEETA